MAIVWAESFDFYGTVEATFNSNLGLRGYSELLARAVTVGARTGGVSLDAWVSSSPTGATRILPAMNNIAFGCAINFRDNIGANAGFRGQGLHFGTGAGEYSFNVIGNAALGIDVRTPAGGSNPGPLIGISAPGLLVINTWYWLEVTAQHNKGNNTINIQVYLNNNLIISISGVAFSGVNDITRFRIGKTGTSGFQTRQAFYDDLVIGDSYIGDSYCFTRVPNSDGVLQDFSRSSGSQAFSLIDELVPNDAGYIFATTSGDISDFGVSGFPAVAGVKAICPVVRAFKGIAGGGDFRLGVQNSGVSASMSAPFTPGTSPVYFSQIFENDPATGAPWTVSGANAAGLRVEYV